ncbi:hypothetical protein COCSADRAFT_326665 [Bipolaris sorokiniana ND90Pr]|uniref:Ig-like domain-containing protein n=1 Tax=Cochliobolus sativus (strain ND90Pr / ATCC 201652) TaxID=665912 RepID=M2T6H9_COCSN|nr:uncharacterized protein COCSADRAFT_326665 [Bipolaris sorokiniana ND90Pr]EMD64567.1 hypothetical protein COCSADRAFT_326665 [Bipolaris sorokiniana ND90Pr]
MQLCLRCLTFLCCASSPLLRISWAKSRRATTAWQLIRTHIRQSTLSLARG